MPITCTKENSMYFITVITLTNPVIKICHVGDHKAQHWVNYYLYCMLMNKATTSNVLEFVLFAHDTTITYSHSYVISNFDMTNSELQEVTNWFKANKLSVDATKTNYEYMLLDTNNKLSRLDESASTILDNTNLEWVNDTKVLGFTIDANLNWTNHHETSFFFFKKIYPGVWKHQ